MCPKLIERGRTKDKGGIKLIDFKSRSRYPFTQFGTRSIYYSGI